MDWAVLGHTGAILGPTGAIVGPYWVILGTYWAIWGPYWAILGNIGAILGHTGTHRAALSRYGGGGRKWGAEVGWASSPSPPPAPNWGGVSMGSTERSGRSVKSSAWGEGKGAGG